MKDRLIKAATKWLALAAAFIFILLITANILIRQPGVQAYFLRQISQSTGYDITAGRIFVSLNRGPSLHALEVVIAAKDGSSLSIPEMYLSLEGSSLFSGRFVPTAISLIGPRIVLDTGGAGRDILAGLLGPEEGRPGADKSSRRFSPGYLPAALLQAFNYYPPSLPKLTFENAAVALNSFPAEGRMIKGAIYAHDEDTLEIKVGGAIVSGPARTSFFSLSGTLRRGTSSEALPSLDANLDLTGLPEDIFNSGALAVVKQDRAHASLRIKTSGESGIFLEGSISARRLHLDINKWDKQIDVAGVEADFSAFLDENGLAVPSLAVTSNGVRVDGEANIQIDGNKAVSIRLLLSSPPTPVTSAREVVPAFLYPDLVGEEILPIVSEGTVRLERLLLNGSFEQISHIETNPDVLLLKLSWSDLALLESKSTPAMRGISGELLFEKGELYISGLRGSWEGSIVEEASMHLADVYGSHRYLFSGHIDASMKDIASLNRLAWFPQDAKEALAWISPDKGTLDMRLSLLMDSGHKRPSLEKAELFLRNCLVTHQSLPFEADIDMASVFMEKSGRGKFTISVLSMDSSIEASGSFDGWGKAALVNANLLVGPEAALRTIFQDGKFSLKAERRLPASINLTINGPAVSCRGHLDLDGLSAEFMDIAMKTKGKDDRLDFAFKIEPDKGFLLEEANFKLGTSFLKFKSESGLIDTGDAIIHMTSQRFFLDDIGLALGGRGIKPSGIFTFDMKAALPNGLLDVFRSGDGSAHLISSAIKEALGRAEGSLVSIPSGLLPLPIDDGEFNLELSEEGIKVDRAAFQAGQSNFRIKGDFTRSKGIKGKVTLLNGFLNISDFISMLDRENLKINPAHYLPGDTDIEIKVEVLRGLWKNVPFGPLDGKASISEGMINIERLSGKAGQCEMDLQAAFRGARTPRMSLSGTLKADNKPAGEVLSMVGLEPDYIEGPLSLSADFATHGDKIDDLLCHLRGELELEVGKGLIRKSHVLLSILRFLSIEKIFYRPPPDLSIEGLYFEGIQGAFRIDGGSISTEDLIMQSPVINVAGTGSLDLTTGSVKAEMVVQPFGMLDAIAGRIPLLGYILTGKDKTLVLYYFHAEGHVKEPTVSYVPFKNLGSSTVGILHRLILTPGRILKKISNAVQRMGDGKPLAPGEEPERAHPR